MRYENLFGKAAETGRTPGPDGTRLYWERYGKNTGEWPTLVCCNGIGCSTFFWHYLARYFSEFTDVIVWDYRGHGVSDWPVDESRVGMEDNADDCHAILTEAGVKDAVLIGHSMGSQVVLEYYRRHPEFVRGLIPLLGTYGHPIDTFYDSGIPAKLFPYISSIAGNFSGAISSVLKFAAGSSLTMPFASATGMVNGGLIKQEDLTPYLEHMASVNVDLFMKMTRRMGDHTTEDILGDIKVPVLIIGGEHDAFTPVWLSEKMKKMIPGSELLMLVAGSHAAIVEQPELINLRVEKFFGRCVREYNAKKKAKPLASAARTKNKSSKKISKPAVKKAAKPAAKKKAAPVKKAAKKPAPKKSASKK